MTCGKCVDKQIIGGAAPLCTPLIASPLLLILLIVGSVCLVICVFSLYVSSTFEVANGVIFTFDTFVKMEIGILV